MSIETKPQFETPLASGTKSPLEQAFCAEKQKRDDTSDYIGDLLARQRRVNYEVLAFSREFLPPESLVIDACAGPEGSLLPASLYGYSWIGNEISFRFAGNLKKTGADMVVISDFAQAPFQEGAADGVFFIFAINNILRPAEALAEAGRIVKENGTMVLAGPGPSFWQTNILLSSLLKGKETGLSKRILGDKCSRGIEQYFGNKPYSEEEYCQFFLEHNLGVTQERLQEVIEEIFRDNGQTRQEEKRISFRFQQEVAALYYLHLVNLAAGEGFEITKVGLMAVARTSPTSKDWQVTSPKKVEVESWLELLMETRKGKTDLLPPAVFSSQCKLIFPVICFRKPVCTPAKD